LSITCSNTICCIGPNVIGSTWLQTSNARVERAAS
jgi:hypothetical protein